MQRKKRKKDETERNTECRGRKERKMRQKEIQVKRNKPKLLPVRVPVKWSEV